MQILTFPGSSFAPTFPAFMFFQYDEPMGSKESRKRRGSSSTFKAELQQKFFFAIFTVKNKGHANELCAKKGKHVH